MPLLAYTHKSRFDQEYFEMTNREFNFSELGNMLTEELGKCPITVDDPWILAYGL